MIENKDLNVIIMAGGLGKRMKSKLPKILHKVQGVPMVARVITQALKLNPRMILLVVGKYRDIIESTLKYHNLDKKVIFIMQEPAMGTGHAIQCCRETLFLKGYEHDKVLILSGDTPLITADLMNQMLDFQDVKIMTTIREDPTGYGRIKIKDNKFVKNVEHKDCTEEELKIKIVNSGIYVFRNHLLWKYLSYLKNNNKQNEYYLTDMLEILKINANVDIQMFLLPKEKQWLLTNVNDQEQLKYVNNLMIEKYLENKKHNFAEENLLFNI